MKGGRGASILSSIIILAIAGATTLATEFGNFQSETQLAQAGTVKPAVSAVKSKTPADEQKEIQQKCEQLKALAIARKSTVGGGETQLQKGKSTPEKDRCVAATHAVTHLTGEVVKCVGLASKVYMDKSGNGKVISTPDDSVEPGTCKVELCPTDVPPATLSAKMNEKCTSSGAVSGTNGVNAADPNLFKNLNKEQQQNVLSGLDKASQDALRSAVTNEQLEAEDAYQEKAVQVADAKAHLESLAKTGCDVEGLSCGPAATEAAKNDLARKEAELKAIEEQKERLAAAQRNLSNVAKLGPPAEIKTNSTGEQVAYPTTLDQVQNLQSQGFDCFDTESGMFCSKNAPKSAPVPANKIPPVEKQPPGEQPPACPPPCTKAPPTNDPPDPRSTFPPVNNPNNGDLASMLQKLLGNIPSAPGGGGPGGAPSPLTGGACVDGVLCQNNALYRQTPSSDTTRYYCSAVPIQQCPYGCSGNACAPAPQAPQPATCSSSPPQPDSAACSGGIWRPTYNGTCIASWQCVGGTAEVSAQLSCQPQVADVGTSIAIAYSCTQGTSAGAGFATGGAQAGSATVVAANPPGETNTASYGLQCTYEGKTVTKECKVQISKPSMVLIANPKNVQRGNTATLGWVTSGMQSCVISSPDLPAFTSTNAAKLNINGTVLTPVLENSARFLLRCTTLGGNMREATSTVEVRN